MNKCPSGIDCNMTTVIWVGNWWADKGRSVFQCANCGWKWLEWN